MTLPSSRCPVCDAFVRWVVTPPPNGVIMIDIEPVDDGPVILTGETVPSDSPHGPDRLEAVVVNDDIMELFPDERPDRYRRHTC